jgi:Papain-like cysteine protease AvrRpt2
MNKLIFLVCYFCVFEVSFAQSVAISPMIPQYERNWCWAACMQMVINYREGRPRVNQVEIVEQFIKEVLGLGSRNCGDKSDNCSKLYGKKNHCNLGMDTSEFVIMLNKLHFNAKLVHNPRVSNFSAHLPSIALIRTTNGPCSPKHAIVCYSANLDSNFIMAIDPKFNKQMCQVGVVKYFPNAMNSPIRICNQVTNIYRSASTSDDRSRDFAAPPPPNNEISSKQSGEILKLLSQAEMDEYRNNTNFQCVDVRYFDYTTFADIKKLSSNINDYLLPNEIVEITQLSKPYTTTSFSRREDGNWEPFMVKSNQPDIIKQWDQDSLVRRVPFFLNFLKGENGDIKVKSMNNSTTVNKAYQRERLLRFHDIDQEFIEYSNVDEGKAVKFRPLFYYKNKLNGPDQKGSNHLYSAFTMISDLKKVIRKNK